MDLCAYGFETRASPSDSLAMTAHLLSWNDAIVSYVLSRTFLVRRYFLNMFQ